MSKLSLVIILIILIFTLSAIFLRRRPLAYHGPEDHVMADEAAVEMRALCLAAVLFRGELEQVYTLAGQAEMQDDAARELKDMQAGLADDLNRWLSDVGIEPYLSDRERALMKKGIGTWNERELINASWRLESLNALLWALGLVDEMQPVDTSAEEKAALKAAGLLKPIADFRERAALRGGDEINKMRDVAELWHWRSRTRTLMVEKRLEFSDEDMNGIIKMSAEQAHRDGVVPEPIDGDFPAFGKAYRDLDDDQFAHVTSVSMERQYALNWVCGYSDDWDDVPTDT